MTVYAGEMICWQEDGRLCTGKVARVVQNGYEQTVLVHRGGATRALFSDVHRYLPDTPEHRQIVMRRCARVWTCSDHDELLEKASDALQGVCAVIGRAPADGKARYIVAGAVSRCGFAGEVSATDIAVFERVLLAMAGYATPPEEEDAV